MTDTELRLRRMSNQYLLQKEKKETVIRALCGFQAQFFSNAMHAMRIRCSDFTEAGAADGLVRNWTLRGTMHVFAEADLPVFVNCHGGRDYCRNEWDGLSFWNSRPCWPLTPARQQELSAVILSSLAEGERTREELKQCCRGAGMTGAEESAMFDPWGGGLRELCERGFVNAAVREEKSYVLCPPFIPLSEEEAECEVTRRYFTHYGPATLRDAAYFFKKSQTRIRQLMQNLPVSSFVSQGKTYYFIENGEPCAEKIPECFFLAGFDPLMLGYEKQESVFLPKQYLRGIFNLAGIVMPAILINGEVAGRWKLKNGKLEMLYFRTLSQRERTLLHETAQETWQDVRIKEMTAE